MFIALIKIIAIIAIAYGAYGLFKKHRNEVNGGTSWEGQPLRSAPKSLSVTMGGKAVKAYAIAEVGVLVLALIGIFA